VTKGAHLIDEAKLMTMVNQLVLVFTYIRYKLGNTSALRRWWC